MKLYGLAGMVCRSCTIYIVFFAIAFFIIIHCVNPLYLIIAKADGYIKESNGNKCLVFALQIKRKKY